MSTPGHAVLLCAVFAGCASEAGDLVQKTAFDTSAGEVEITVDGDGFVHSGGRRLPLEAIVLELRQRTRSMPKDELEQRFVVHLHTAPQSAGTDAAANARQGMDRLVRELQVMGVRQVRFL
jgi:hypothetical protein